MDRGNQAPLCRKLQLAGGVAESEREGGTEKERERLEFRELRVNLQTPREHMNGKRCCQ